jgi:hypothetical protein
VEVIAASFRVLQLNPSRSKRFREKPPLACTIDDPTLCRRLAINKKGGRSRPEGRGASRPFPLPSLDQGAALTLPEDAATQPARAVQEAFHRQTAPDGTPLSDQDRRLLVQHAIDIFRKQKPHAALRKRDLAPQAARPACSLSRKTWGPGVSAATDRGAPESAKDPRSTRLGERARVLAPPG